MKKQSVKKYLPIAPGTPNPVDGQTLQPTDRPGSKENK
jgi:hypothetical protein